MIVDINEALADALYTEFGADYALFSSVIEQGNQHKSFHIKCLESPLVRELTDRFRYNLLYSIQYFPNDDRDTDELNAVAERVMDCLFDIPLGDGYIHAENINSVVLDGVLTVTFSIDVTVRRALDLDLMMEEKVVFVLEG